MSIAVKVKSNAPPSDSAVHRGLLNESLKHVVYKFKRFPNVRVAPVAAVASRLSSCDISWNEFSTMALPRHLNPSLLVLLSLFLLLHKGFQFTNAQAFDERSTNQELRKFSFAANSESMVSNGKQEYEVLLERKKSPLYGKCWSNAILKLEKSCNQLDENRQSWLAILFTDCFLKTSGFGNDLFGEPCHSLIDSNNYVFSDLLASRVKECAKSIDMKIFHTYSLFFVHTQSICFYLQSEQWQKQTENLVDSLVLGAHVVSTDLNSAVGKIHQLEILQNSSLKAQISLNSELTQAKNSLEKFQEQTKEQRDLIEKVIDQFILLRQFLLVEFSTSSAIVFYIFAMLVIYFITTPQRTIGSRLILYFMLVVTFILEKYATDYLLRIDLFINSKLFAIDDFDNFNINRNIWTIRKFMLISMTATYFWWLVTYRDISQINYKLLSENTLILKNIQNQLLNSPKHQAKPLEYFSDDSSHCDSESSTSDSFSDYESGDDSFISTDIESDSENMPNCVKYNLRSPSIKLVHMSLPKQYENESVSDFVRNVRSSMKKSTSRERLNFYSSDEN